jgi:xanthine dehydrogenase YagR molybdenum-binding subunit
LPQENVRIVCPFTGGAFGSKGFQWSHTLLAAAAAKQVQRPVKLTLTRPQMFDSAGQRARTEQRLSVGVDKTGKLVALRHATTTHSSPTHDYTEPCGNTSRMLYSCPNVEVSHRLVRLNLTTPCPMRAPGETPGVFALECAVDELAHEIGVDPVEFRLRNYAEIDEYQNKPWSSKKLRECYQRGAQKFGWSNRNKKPGSMRAAEGSQIGFGMATAVYPAGQQKAGATAILNKDGTVVVRSATHEIGTGTYTGMSQFAADMLGIPIEKIRFELGDSQFSYAPNNGGSWLTASVAPAVMGACTELKKKVLRGMDTTNNPRQIVFINPPDVKDPTNPRSGIARNTTNINGIPVASGDFVDPWGTPYNVAIDGGYDNQIANAYTDGSAGGDPNATPAMHYTSA